MACNGGGFLGGGFARGRNSFRYAAGVEQTFIPNYGVDGDTFAMWQFDETSAGDYVNVADSSGGGRTLTGSSAANSPKITNARNSLGEAIRYARLFSGDASTVATRAGDAGSLAVVSGSHTLEAIVRVDSLAARNWLLSYAGIDDSSSATNNQTGLIVETTGKLSSFWESGTGTDRTVTQTAGGTVTEGTWTYIAAAIDRSAMTIRWAIKPAGGSIQYDTTSYSTNPTGGGSAAVSWCLGRSAATGGTYFTGACSCVRVSSVVRSDSDMATAALALDSGMKFSSDASTHALWLMNEAPDAIDDCDRGMHLISLGSTVTLGSAPLTSLGRSKTFSGSSGRLEANPPPDPNTVALTALMKTEFCVELVFRLGDGNASTRGLWINGDPGPETAANNFFGCEVHWTTPRSLRVFSENGAGLDSIYTTGEMFAAAAATDVHRLALNVKLSSGSQFFEVYFDGALFATSSTFTTYSDALSSYLRLGWGPASNYWFGSMDSVRISTRARTAAEIASFGV